MLALRANLHAQPGTREKGVQATCTRVQRRSPHLFGEGRYVSMTLTPSVGWHFRRQHSLTLAGVQEAWPVKDCPSSHAELVRGNESAGRQLAKHSLPVPQSWSSADRSGAIL